VYNGDTDPGINSFVAQNWTVALGLEETEAWRPWTLDGCQRMGGYLTSYAGDFAFLTIRGSGHMVSSRGRGDFKLFAHSEDRGEGELEGAYACVVEARAEPPAEPFFAGSSYTR